MSLRSGGSPRGSQAHLSDAHDGSDAPAPELRLERDLRSTQALREARASRARETGRPNGGLGVAGLLRFLVFAVILAAVVLVAGLTVLRPVVAGAVVDWASGTPGLLRWPFVADLVREDLGASLTDPASTDPTQVDFTVKSGDTATSIADRLAGQGLLKDPRAFVFIAVEHGSDTKLEVGDYVLRRNMTPDQLVGSLLEARDPAITITLREGLRIEQIAAKLQTEPLTMDVNRFYQLAEHPPVSLLAGRPWLQLPAGASLEGYLAPDTYRVLPDTTPEEFLGMLLDHFHEVVGDARMTVPAARGMTFSQILVLASIVEQEAVVDSERPLIAGVYQNRLRKKMLLQSDPTVIYGNDTLQLEKLPFQQWPRYSFGSPFPNLSKAVFPGALARYQTYESAGLPPGPICTPTVASIDAALDPNTATGYLYFVAKGDGSHTHAFAKTYAQHLANLKKYGYQ